jgi:uncharacterized protein (UPF0264 family)
MKLLVSVTSAIEAKAALDGGADLIDAKDPSRGALGVVPLPTLRAIVSTVGGARPVTAALGDAFDEATIEREASGFAAAGSRLVKIGFAGITDTARVTRLTAAAVRGVAASATTGVVVVAYADANQSGVERGTYVDIAAQAGAVGVLLDTMDKQGPGLTRLVTGRALTSWVKQAHDAGLIVALAGKLTADDLALVRDTGADIAGVRGAACDGGRLGRVTSTRVRALVQDMRLSAPASVE